MKRREQPRNVHPGDSIGGHGGISPNTRRIVVAELRAQADRLTNPVDASLLRSRAGEIEDAGNF